MMAKAVAVSDDIDQKDAQEPTSYTNGNEKHSGRDNVLPAQLLIIQEVV